MIIAVSPAHAAGAVDVTVSNAAGTSPASPADVFAVRPPPAHPQQPGGGPVPAEGSAVGTPSRAAFLNGSVERRRNAAAAKVANQVENKRAAVVTPQIPPSASQDFHGDPDATFLQKLDMRGANVPMKLGDGRALGNANLAGGIIAGAAEAAALNAAANAGQAAVKVLEKVPVAGPIGGVIGRAAAGQPLGPAETAAAVAKSVSEGLADEELMGDIADQYYHLHHSIPKEIQGKLPEHLQNDQDIIGRKGLPNRIPVEAEKHLREVHDKTGINPKESGIYGGKYNKRFHDEIIERGGYKDITKEDILEIRDLLVKEFGL
jgi:hypothetical protein